MYKQRLDSYYYSREEMYEYFQSIAIETYSVGEPSRIANEGIGVFFEGRNPLDWKVMSISVTSSGSFIIGVQKSVNLLIDRNGNATLAIVDGKSLITDVEASESIQFSFSEDANVVSDAYGRSVGTTISLDTVIGPGLGFGTSQSDDGQFNWTTGEVSINSSFLAIEANANETNTLPIIEVNIENGEFKINDLKGNVKIEGNYKNFNLKLK